VKRVLLTGARVGIGRAIAEALVENDCAVWGTSRDPRDLPSHPNFHPLGLDLCDSNSIRSAIEIVLKESGGVDVLINNAGAGVYAPLELMSREDFVSQLQILLIGPWELAKLIIPGMRERGSGLIINMTSLASRYPIPFMGAYSASKAALSSLTWTLQMELCRDPIRIVDIQPGDTRTSFHETMQQIPFDAAGVYEDNLRRAYAVYTQRMSSAPRPDRVVRSVLSLIRSNRRTLSPIAAGTPFQARIGPFFTRLLPAAWIREIVRGYYRMTRAV
jgi:NAD(P)-dependent dehydrogenase (short-subunit alcohol dehydrogenase family)